MIITRPWRLNSLAALLAMVFAAAFLWGTGLVPKWGQWYSAEKTYRQQTTAFFNGSLAISDEPSRLAPDLVWHNGGVQQVWGLGIPAWLTPLNGLARLFGQPAFPERLAFGIALALVAFAAFKFLLLPPELADNKGLVDLVLNPIRLCAVAAILLFPPILNTCRLHFTIYDEAVVYGYLCSIGLFFGIFSFVRHPGKAKFLIIALLAGLGPMVRPTLLAYSLATMALLGYYGFKAGFRGPLLFTGGGLFALGGGLLFVTNLVRFGSGLEFGHNLNLNGFPVWYFTRFYCPYQNESLFSAARELFGSLFCVTRLNGFNHLQESFFWGQSAAPRWRQFYMSTFDFSFLACVVGGWFVIVGAGIPRVRKRLLATLPREVFAIGLWSLTSVLLLAAFYLKSPAIASRYMLDFSAGFVAASVGLILCLERLSAMGRKLAQLLPHVVFGVGLLWFTWEIYSVKSVPVLTSRPLTQTQVVRYAARKAPPSVPPASSCETGTNLISLHIPFNGAGWDFRDMGAMETVAAIFVKDPEFLELHVSTVERALEGQVDYSKLRVKIGLEYLELDSIKPLNGEHIVTFKAPRKPVYRSGIQVAFIAFVDPGAPLNNESPLKMQKAVWRYEPPIATTAPLAAQTGQNR